MKRSTVMMVVAALLPVIVAAALTFPGCAERDPVESSGKADVRPLGDPVMTTLAYGGYRVWISFGGAEFILVDPSTDYDPAYIDQLCGPPFVRCRYAAALWEGQVKNYGHAIAESVYVRIQFAGEFIDSAYVEDMLVRPNETARYMVYTRGTQVERIEVIWYGQEEDG
jgi:hypothetical protein